MSWKIENYFFLQNNKIKLMFKRNSFVIVFSQKLLSYVLPSEARFKTNVNFILPRKLIKKYSSHTWIFMLILPEASPIDR